MRSRLLRPLEVLIPAATGTAADRVYGSSYQGNRIGLFRFRQPQGNGNSRCPLRLQGARIAGITPRLSLNYEWGSAHLSAGSRMTISAIPTIL